MSLLKFDDIRIVPQLTPIESRSECDTTTVLGPFELTVPLMVASMHSLVTMPMVSYVEGAGSIVVQPRQMEYLNANRLALSTGFETAMRRASVVNERGGILSVEVANGYQKRMWQLLADIKANFPNVYILAGTVCTLEGFDILTDYADAVLMGIGVGNACTTTINTGVGLPAAEMLMRLKDKGIDRPIILCGGVRTYGDVVKAIALGADVVMSGYLFKDCTDTGQRYYGEASAQHKNELEYVEGTELKVNKSARTSYDVITGAKQALQSAMSYSNAYNLDQFRARVNLVT